MIQALSIPALAWGNVKDWRWRSANLTVAPSDSESNLNYPHAGLILYDLDSLQNYVRRHESCMFGLQKYLRDRFATLPRFH